MNIAITGATGFLGSYLHNTLVKEGHTITIFDKKIHDLMHYETLKEFVSDKDIVIHLAGISKNNVSDFIQKINVDGTAGLLKAIKRYNPSAKLIFSSSLQVYVENGTFGNSKRDAEKLIEKYNKKYNIQAIILRFSNLYGPNCIPFHNSAVCTFAYQIKKKELVTLYGGTQKRDYIYITDAVSSVLLSIKYNPNGVAYFDVCSGELTSLQEILDTLKSFTKQRISVYNKPLDKPDAFFVQKDYTKAKKLLGWGPKVPLDKGLKLLAKSKLYEYKIKET